MVSSRRRPPLSSLLLPALLLVGAGFSEQAEAQLRVVPGVGLYAPLSDLGEIRGEVGQRLIDAGRRNSTVALSLGVEVGDAGSSLGFRGRVDYGTRARVPIEGVGCPDCELRASLLAASADLILRPLPRLLLLQPFVAGGLGVKHYGFEREDLEPEGFPEAFRSQTRPALRAAVGSQFFLGALRPQVEASVVVSRFETHPDAGHLRGEDRLQSDLFVSVSLAFGGR